MSSCFYSPFRGVWATSGSDAWAVGPLGGGLGGIIHYDGAGWGPTVATTSTPLYGIWAISYSEIFAAGGNGTVWSYDGATWNPSGSPISEDLYALWRTSGSNLFAAGGNGTILHYNGSLWADVTGPPYQHLYDDKQAIGGLLSNLGIVARRQGDSALARSLHEEALAIRREQGDRRAIGVSLNNLRNGALDQGNYAEARALHEEGLAIRHEVGDRWAIANALNNLGNLARTQGNYEEASKLYQESLAIYRVLGDKWALAYLFEDVGCLRALKSQAVGALLLAGTASTLRAQIGAPLSPAEEEKLERALRPAREALNKAAQAEAWARGRSLSPEDAIAEALIG